MEDRRPPPPPFPPPPPPPAQPPSSPPPPPDPMAIVAPLTKAPAETFTRSFILLSLKRAFRLHIQTDEVLPAEHAHIARTAPHVRNPEHQAYLAWRRSVLLLVAILFVPLTVSRFIETWDGPDVPHLGRSFLLLPALAEAGFCIIAFDQLKNWANWKRQRRVLFIAWGLYFVAPFIVFLYPFRSAFDTSVNAAMQALHDSPIPIKISRTQLHMALGLVFGVKALLTLGPKVISLMPGLIRASIVSKLQFPGTTAPGWLMMLAAPLYALFAYIIVVLPYQITASWQFLVGNAGVLLAQIFIGISGRRLTVPLTTQESYDRIHKTWLAYIGILVISAGFMVYGLYDFIHELHLGMIHVVTSVLSFAANVLLDTLVGADAIVAAMAYFRKSAAPDPLHQQLFADAQAKLDVFTT